MKTEETRKAMNRNFKVKVNFGRKSTLVGWQGLVLEVGRSKAFLLVCSALNSRADKWTYKGRNGRIIRFYAK